jgi:hypothetical protein
MSHQDMSQTLMALQGMGSTRERYIHNLPPADHRFHQMQVLFHSNFPRQQHNLPVPLHIQNMPCCKRTVWPSLFVYTFLLLPAPNKQFRYNAILQDHLVWHLTVCRNMMQ